MSQIIPDKNIKDNNYNNLKKLTNNNKNNNSENNDNNNNYNNKNKFKNKIKNLQFKK
jgi:hypothetical protein